MNIEIGKRVGDWHFGMSKGQIVDLLQEDSVVENWKVITKNHEFYFDPNTGLKSITLKAKAEGNIQGIGIGSSLKQASDIFGESPIFSQDHDIIFNSLKGIGFDLGEAKMELLYESGAVEDGELDEKIHKAKKLKIKKIFVCKYN